MSRLIDADAFSAVMKQRQDTVKEWMCKGKDKETCARAGSSYVMLCEVKLTLDQMPTIDAVPINYIMQRANVLKETDEYGARVLYGLVMNWNGEEQNDGEQ